MEQGGVSRSSQLGSSSKVEDFIEVLDDAKISRVLIASRDGRATMFPEGAPRELLDLVTTSPDFAEHEAIFIQRSESFPTVFFAFVHSTRRGLAQGGLRLDEYDTFAAFLSDGLRLAQGMTRKNALAGLWWGGGKAIIPLTKALRADKSIVDDKLSEPRRRLMAEYGSFIASLGGAYYTAADKGTYLSDMRSILAENRFVTCLDREVGGSGDPSPFTAKGVFEAMKAGWKYLRGSDSLVDVHVAIQGVGKVGGPLAEFLLDAGARLTVADDKAEKPRLLAEAHPGRVQVVRDNEILEIEADILAPCAQGKVVTAETVEKLAVKMVCGGANNILETPEDDDRLQARGILYVPDYVANRSGIINCANEWQGYLQEDVEKTIPEIGPLVTMILEDAKASNYAPSRVADRMADEAVAKERGPLGDRGTRIIDHLRERWVAAKR